MLRATFKHYKKFQYLQENLYTNSKFFSSIYQAVNQEYSLEDREVKHTNRVQELINKYRKNSHHYSDLDPLGLHTRYIMYWEIMFLEKSFPRLINLEFLMTIKFPPSLTQAHISEVLVSIESRSLKLSSTKLISTKSESNSSMFGLRMRENGFTTNSRNFLNKA